MVGVTVGVGLGVSAVTRVGVVGRSVDVGSDSVGFGFRVDV